MTNKTINGSITLLGGFFKILLPLDITPVDVTLSVQSQGYTGCAQQPRDTIQWEQHAEGIIIEGIIESTSAIVMWAASGPTR